MSAGGVVRSINSWGTLTLPQRMKRHGRRHDIAEFVFLNTSIQSASSAVRPNHVFLSSPQQLLDTSLWYRSQNPPHPEFNHAPRPTCNSLDRAEVGYKGRGYREGRSKVSQGRFGWGGGSDKLESALVWTTLTPSIQCHQYKSRNYVVSWFWTLLNTAPPRLYFTHVGFGRSSWFVTGWPPREAGVS